MSKSAIGRSQARRGKRSGSMPIRNVQELRRTMYASAPLTASSFDDPGSGVTAAGSRRSKIIDGPELVPGPWQLPGLLLPCHQVELVALRVSEGGLADRCHAGWQRRRRERDLVERPGAQGGQPLGLLVVVVGDQDGMDAVLGGPGPGGMVENHPGTAVGAGG